MGTEIGMLGGYVFFKAKQRQVTVQTKMTKWEQDIMT